MIYLKKEDYFEVYLGSMISNIDKDVLFTLYQPILGHDAVALYLTLYSEFKKQEITSFSSHEELMELMDINILKLQESRKLLEGIGLLQTYYKSDKNGNSFYKYILLSPKSPTDFLNDILYRGLLVRAIGAKKVNQISNLYKSKEIDLEGYSDISDSFKNVFKPSFDSSSFNTSIPTDNTFTKNTKDISKEFDKGAFLSSLEDNHGIKKTFIKEDDLNEISRISLLYGISEIDMCDIIHQAIKDDKIDFELVKNLSLNSQKYSTIITNDNLIKSNDLYNPTSLKAKKIKLMSETSALDYLKLKQNNNAISPSDVKIIDDLSQQYNLPSQVINPLIDYVLENYDNTLPRNLVLKIAASLVRNNIQTTIDAMNYLYKVKNSKKTSKIDKKDENDKENVTVEDIKNLLKELGDE